MVLKREFRSFVGWGHLLTRFSKNVSDTFNCHQITIYHFFRLEQYADIRTILLAIIMVAIVANQSIQFKYPFCLYLVNKKNAITGKSSKIIEIALFHVQP